ncbi:uncharacterized protein LOC130613968 isoform X2 [Hydractinia symbiolongicarpus]|uniref:uncharacterized protein LOC130613968 isoform X2 n=1 Tax=Hydractinia symbiolongicarpus TaxID=13093 RepID=UPI0025510F91|nr:uncharacterized protein LOC130613968 isoform X2 [Hydractinia symbiolongicarpus]
MFGYMLCLFAFALAASFKNALSHWSSYGLGRVDFFIFVMVVAWLGVIALFLVYFLNIINKLKQITPLVFIVLALLHLFGALFILISTGLVLDDCITTRTAHTYRYSYCDYISAVTKTSCPVYEASGVCGFFAFIAVAFDAVLHVLKAVQEYRIVQANRASSAQPNEVL